MTRPLLVVRVGPYDFGAPISAVTEILSRPEVTALPRVPQVVAGMAVVRGQPLAVLSLRPLLGLERSDSPLALRWQWEHGVVLVTVDEVDSLDEVGAALPAEVWAGLIPASVAPWVTAGHRYRHGWLWEWPVDLPELLLRAATMGTGQVAS